MIAGFALVAWPAEWGNTGVMTFILNQRGKVYQKNLGPKTPSLAKAMTTYDPDTTWTVAKENFTSSPHQLFHRRRLDPLPLVSVDAG
jgi:hypothetical protein